MLRFLLRRQVRRTTLFVVFFVAILVGLALSRLGIFVDVWWLPVVAIIGAVGALWRPRLWGVSALVAAGLFIGTFQGAQFLKTLSPYSSLYGQAVSLTGVIEEDPTYSSKGSRQFFLGNVKLQTGQALPGSVFVSTPFSADVRRHDRVQVEATMREGFGQFQGSLSFAKVTRLAEEQHVVDDVRSQFAAGVGSVLPEPHASLGLGFVIGMKSALPEQMEDALRQLSLTHIVVASGYNLTILVRAAKRLREKHSKLQTLLLSFSLIGVFLLVTGASPSMVRAGLVSGLVLLAWYFGRAFKPLVILLLVMAGTALAYPPYLWGDLGWWLSFAAFFGIMIVVPLLVERFWKQRQPGFVTQIAIEALVAQLMTLPILLLVFGDLSLLGVLANVLIVPLIPFAMLATALAGFSAMLVPAVAAYLALPAHAILAIIVSLVHLLSAMPWVSVSWPITLPVLVVWYVMVATVVMLMWQKLSRQRRARVLEQQIV